MHTTQDNDELIFTKAAGLKSVIEKNDTMNTPWKIMIIDDDSVIHDVSRLVLSDLTFKGRPIKIIDGYSGKEAIELISKNPDTALILLDVVMETDHAGLDVVKHIRENLNNLLVRIVLRTGQPGNAPEDEIIHKYDINDYKEKTELTARKLHTSVITSLRSYANLKILLDTQIDYANKKILYLESKLQSLQDKRSDASALNSSASLEPFILTQLITQTGHWERAENEKEIILSDSAKQLLNINEHKASYPIDVITSGITGPNKTEILTNLSDAISNKTDFDLTYDVADANGRLLTIHHIGRYVRSEDGEPAKFIATLQNMTPD